MSAYPDETHGNYDQRRHKPQHDIIYVHRSGGARERDHLDQEIKEYDWNRQKDGDLPVIYDEQPRDMTKPAKLSARVGDYEANETRYCLSIILEIVPSEYGITAKSCIRDHAVARIDKENRLLQCRSGQDFRIHELAPGMTIMQSVFDKLRRTD